MNIQLVNPRKSLNKAFLKQKPLRSEIELFKKNLIRLLDKIDEIEREENQKNHIRDFLRDTFYKETNEINTKDTKDLVIHLGKTNKDKVGVIIEAKRPGNKTEMLSLARPNSKALQELVLYYLRERIEENNIDIKYLIATNVYEWYIFEAATFEKLFYRNKPFVKQYEQWRDGQKVTRDTNLFYNDIARPFIDSLTDEIACTHFDIRKYETILRNENKEDDKSLIALQKLLSPNHLLKVPFTNDSNSLNEKFYKELLHIIGLEEVKEGSKNIIRRKITNRQSGSLLENTINILETDDSLRRIRDKAAYGDTRNDQLFSIALELCLTWINRVLFLKLLEGQLITYHKGDPDYRFLNAAMITDYDELYKLFHQVLARNVNERTANIQHKYSRVPYLNSSLFEISDLEAAALKINSLDNSETLELISTTILKDERKKNASLPTLHYLFKFLDAYDFASEGGEDIAEDNKTIINASVLGKVFEKINGYKDGSIFTPGFITMYMSRQSLRPAVIQKFNEHFKTAGIAEAATFEELYNRVDKVEIKAANEIVNSLRVCDPAVGSGHFLVSALNELILIKSELGILADKNGRRLRDYEFTIENDELIITDEHGLFVYNHLNKESQRVQETIFGERQTIIENCLFGVDINPNSVKICRLRLWIELLKSSYYKAPAYTELETLPNIDINIKCGNSLISRFPVDANLSKALKSIKYDIHAYRGFVNEYKNEKNHEVKHGLQLIIDTIKNDFRINIDDPFKSKISKARGEVTNLLTELNRKQQWGEKLPKELKDKLDRATKKLTKLETEKETILNNAIYKNAFEWRFEFPEVLNDVGDFVGFDVVIGNPPYISAMDLKKALDDKAYKQLKNDYLTAKGTVDLFIYFFELGLKILKTKATLAYITPNRYLSASYGEALREFLFRSTEIREIVDYSNVKVFAEASTYPILTFLNKRATPSNKYLISIGKYDSIADAIIYKKMDSSKLDLLQGYIWGFLLNEKITLTEKVINQSESIINCALINATSTASEADEYHSLINQEQGLKLINTGTIDKYESSWGKEFLTDKGEKYLRPFLSKDTGTISQQRMHLYESPKIVLAKIALSTEAFYDEFGEYASINTNCLHSFKPDYDARYVLAWLNSKLFQFTFECFFEGLKMQGGYLLYSAPNVSKMYIKNILKSDQQPFIQLVDQILEAKKHGQETLALEQQVDELVYGLYGITEEERRLIEWE
ncbi:MAG: Eco57I restriction-modification methylase domain-containing protein [Lentimicrobiaceae bacterium]|jgi:hypothetical protein